MPVGNCCGWCLLYGYGIYAGCFFYMAGKDIVCEYINKWKNDVDTSGFEMYERIEQTLSTIEEDSSDDSDIFEEDRDAVVINNINFLIKEKPQNGMPKWTVS